MPATANEALLDEAISHQVALARYSNGVVRRMIAVLNRSDAPLLDSVQKAMDKLTSDAFTVARLESLLGSMRAINAAAFGQLGDALTAELKSFAEYEASYLDSMLSEVLPIGVHFASVTPEQVYTAAMSRPFQGNLLKTFLADLEADRARRVRMTISQGYVQQKSIGEIVRDLRGTRAKGFSDGVLDITRRNAEAVTRTAISHMAATGRNRFHKENDDLIKTVMWVATLDNRTTPICRARDGKEYTNDTHEPIEHDLPWLGGPGQAHWGCRSTSVPVLKSFAELGLDIADFSPSTRASLDGQVPANMTYAEWLTKQPAAKQDEILGADKGALFRTGEVAVDKFVNDKGKTLTLDELKALQPKAYHDAGLDLPYRPPRGTPQDAIAKFLQSKEAQDKLLGSLYREQGMDYAEELGTVRAIKAEEGYTSTDQSLAAVRYYTGEGYRPINARMRESGGTLEDRQFMSLTVDSFPGIGPYDGTIWRSPTTKAANADGWWERAVVGQALDMGNQLQSFSASPEIASAFSRSSDLLLRVKSNKIGVYIDPLSLNKGEHEVLLQPGLKWKVVDKTTATVNGRTYRVIDLEVESE